VALHLLEGVATAVRVALDEAPEEPVTAESDPAPAKVDPAPVKATKAAKTASGAPKVKTFAEVEAQPEAATAESGEEADTDA